MCFGLIFILAIRIAHFSSLAEKLAWFMDKKASQNLIVAADFVMNFF